MLYPLLFEPIYKETIWGGNHLQKIFDRQLPYEKTGESWDVSCRKNEMSIVRNGPYKGRGLDELIYSDWDGFMGSRICKDEPFPLLAKWIDAADDLSIQVHPDDQFARVHEDEKNGKNELWYVQEAGACGDIILGHKDGVTKEKFLQAIDNGQLEECLYRLPVKKGDIVYIPSGTIHGITKGTVVAEIQQNCDLTYRVYDYDRIGLDGKLRPLHLDKFLSMSNFEPQDIRTLSGLTIDKKCARETYYTANKYFSMVKLEVDGICAEKTYGETFFIYICVEGEGSFTGAWGKTGVKAGDMVFVPAGLGEFIIEGNPILLKTWVPDIKKEFIAPLEEAGYEMAEILKDTLIDYFPMR